MVIDYLTFEEQYCVKSYLPVGPRAIDREVVQQAGAGGDGRLGHEGHAVLAVRVRLLQDTWWNTGADSFRWRDRITFLQGTDRANASWSRWATC